MIENHFFPIQYLPDKREIIRLKSFRTDQFNTIYIKDIDFVKKRINDSSHYKIGNYWL